MAMLLGFRYNSPAVMVASILLFYWVREWKMQSKMINWVSSSVLSVYIIHMEPFGSHIFFTPLKRMISHLNAWGACSGMVAFTLVFYAACIVLDKIRIAVCSPLNNWLVRKATCFMNHIDSCLLKKSV